MSESRVTRADAPRLLEYRWGEHDLRWELERLRMDRQKFASDFRNVLEGYLRTIVDDNPTPPISGVTVSSSVTPEPSENIKAAIETAV